MGNRVSNRRQQMGGRVVIEVEFGHRYMGPIGMLNKLVGYGGLLIHGNSGCRLYFVRVVPNAFGLSCGE